MNIIKTNTFKDLFHSIKLNGLYIFIIDDCIVCDQYIEKIKKNKYFTNFNLVNCLEDIVFYMEDVGLDDIPYTIVYNNNTRLYECGGILFDKQVNELRKYI